MFFFDFLNIFYYFVGNKLICNCDLKWIVNLHAKIYFDREKQYPLATITCFMENKTLTISQIEEAEKNQAQLHLIALNEGEK